MNLTSVTYANHHNESEQDARTATHAANQELIAKTFMPLQGLEMVTQQAVTVGYIEDVA